MLLVSMDLVWLLCRSASPPSTITQSSSAGTCERLVCFCWHRFSKNDSGASWLDVASLIALQSPKMRMPSAEALVPCSPSNLSYILHFTTLAADLAIWLANFPLLIRVQITLLESMCRAMSFSARALKKTHFLWRWYCGKKTLRMWLSVLVVWTLIDNNTRHHSGQNIVEM